jgi:predicted RNase H-like HicB family nuclease
MKYVYPAIFTPIDDGRYDVYAPDLPYCRTCGHDLAEAIEMAEDAISMWLWDAENKNEDIPVPSKNLSHEPLQFVNFIKADTDLFRRKQDNRAIKKTITIPAWLNAEAEDAHVNFSSVFQSALKKHLSISD